jgi:hypothetical protein
LIAACGLLDIDDPQPAITITRRTPADMPAIPKGNIASAKRRRIGAELE